MRRALSLVLFVALTVPSAEAQSIHEKKTYPEFSMGPTGIVATIEKAALDW